MMSGRFTESFHGSPKERWELGATGPPNPSLCDPFAQNQALRFVGPKHGGRTIRYQGAIIRDDHVLLTKHHENTAMLP